MNYLSQAQSGDFAGKKVLVRLDLNVPLTPFPTGEGLGVMPEDADRITQSLPTIEFLKNAGAKVIIISHIGRDPEETLDVVAKYMNIPLMQELSEGGIDGLLETHQVIMLENLRKNRSEESNDENFAKQLASYADIYVNDAFAVSHRAHASIVSIPKFLPSYAGLQMEKEITHLSQAFHPESPSILVLGGAKFETKLPVIQKFLPIVDTIIIGGALINNFYKEMGYEIGSSLIDTNADIKSIFGNPKILTPEVVIVENDKGQEEKNIRDVVLGDKVVDIAPSGLDEYREIFQSAQFIIWNGPLGNYENGFTKGTQKMVELMALSQGNTIVGGGDSVALIEQLGIAHKFTFLSTGGGAMLEYLASGTLPGIEALQ